MRSDGLDEILKNKTEQGYFTGWVWVKYTILETNAHLASRCIIYSAYLDSFLKVNHSKEEKRLIDQMLKMDKSDLGWREKLMARLKA